MGKVRRVPRCRIKMLLLTPIYLNIKAARCKTLKPKLACLLKSTLLSLKCNKETRDGPCKIIHRSLLFPDPLVYHNPQPRSPNNKFPKRFHTLTLYTKQREVTQILDQVLSWDILILPYQENLTS